MSQALETGGQQLLLCGTLRTCNIHQRAAGYESTRLTKRPYTHVNILPSVKREAATANYISYRVSDCESFLRRWLVGLLWSAPYQANHDPRGSDLSVGCAAAKTWNGENGPGLYRSTSEWSPFANEICSHAVFNVTSPVSRLTKSWPLVRNGNIEYNVATYRHTYNFICTDQTRIGIFCIYIYWPQCLIGKL